MVCFCGVCECVICLCGRGMCGACICVCLACVVCLFLCVEEEGEDSSLGKASSSRALDLSIYLMGGDATKHL